MIKRVINSEYFGETHPEAVSRVVDELQDDGYMVTRIYRVQRGFVFGDDITDIYYLGIKD